MTNYDPDRPKSAEEIELEDTIRRLAYRLRDAREDSAEYKMIERQNAIGRQLGDAVHVLPPDFDVTVCHGAEVCAKQPVEHISAMAASWAAC